MSFAALISPLMAQSGHGLVHRVVATLHNHEILTDNDLAFEIFCDWLLPGVVTDTINRRRQMRQHERLYSRFLGNPADVFGRCVIGLHMRHKGLELDGSASGDLILDVFFDPAGTYIVSCTSTSAPWPFSRPLRVARCRRKMRLNGP